MSEISIESINKIVNDDPVELINFAEEKYHTLVGEIANRVCRDKNIKIVLLAGPSGSGKTTTANLLCDRIKSHGEGCIVVSLDDFYRSATDADYPRQKNGERDLESPLALDIDLLVSTLRDISESRDFLLPKYDFKVSARSEMRKISAMKDGCVIIEGLHALNPLIFSSLPKERLLKIFISVSTNLTLGGERVLSGRKLRFMRRMIRDSIYRGADAKMTLSLWKNVLLGEDEYLYPNRKYADISFDTFHAFECSVMRPFVERLISPELARSDEYAAVVLSAARQLYPIDISGVPDTSLIREFIPGGKYESLY